MKKYIFAALICLFFADAYAQKDVYWIHGLGENSGFWQRYRNEISGYHRGNEIDWDSRMPIQTIANGVSKSIETNAVLVSHSAGGLVAREIQKSNSHVKAIVTVGTPNQGAGVVTSINNRSYYNVIDESVNKTERAVQRSLSALEWCAPPVSNMVSPIVFRAKRILSDVKPIAKVAIKMKAKQEIDETYTSDRTVQDMNPNGSFIRNLNGQRINVPIVNIYGAEDYWQVVRMSGSLSNRNTIVSIANTTDSTYDEAYFPDIRKVEGGINEICQVHGQVYKHLKWPAIAMPWIWGTREFVKSAKGEWEGVNRYLTYDAHNSYSELIGAVHWEERWYKKRRKWRSYWAPVYEDHDGLIANKHSQIPENKGVYVRNVRIPGVNHMEMSGHKLINAELKKILNADGQNYDKAFNQAGR